MLSQQILVGMIFSREIGHMVMTPIMRRDVDSVGIRIENGDTAICHTKNCQTKNIWVEFMKSLR